MGWGLIERADLKREQSTSNLLPPSSNSWQHLPPSPDSLIPCLGGRLRRKETGDWVWSSDEEGDSDDETIQKKKSNKQVPQ